jgi:glycosyltransferase involved in cell wall biosynthesis
MANENKYNYYYITGCPIFEYNNTLFWEDAWARNVLTGLKFWKNTIIISPLKKIKKIDNSIIPFPVDSVKFIPLNGNKIIIYQYLQLLKILPCVFGDNESIYTFSGNLIGKFGFFYSFLKGEKNRFIGYDAPVELVKFTKGEYRGLQNLKKLFIPIYCVLMKHYRRWSIKKAVGVTVVGDGIIDEINLSIKDFDNILSLPLSLENEESLINSLEFSEIWEDKKNNNDYIIMCADRFSPEKGIFEFISSINLLNKNNEINFKVLLFSGGPCLEKVLENIRHYQLEDKVVYMGKVTRQELISWMRKSDIFVNLTKTYDFNRTMIEAAGQGCAILGSDLVGVRSFFTSGKSCLLVNPRDPFAIFLGLKELLDNYELRMKTSSNALQFAYAHTADKSHQQIRDFYVQKLAYNSEKI